MNENNNKEEIKPMLANCKKIEIRAPLGWLALGWQDCKNAPKHSGAYGLFVVLISYFVFSIAWHYNSITLALGLLSAFIFVAPVLCLGLYSIARQLGNNQTIDFRESIKYGLNPYGDLMIFVIMMMVISLVWARSASMIHIFFPLNHEGDFSELFIFLGIGSFIGSIFAILIFSISVFSLPMIMDKKTDMITACISSVNAVLRNKLPMLFWALIVVTLTGIGIMTAFIGFLVIMPLLGYSTWHGYQECLDVSPWEDRGQDTNTSN